MPSTAVRRGLYWSESTQTWHFEFRSKLLPEVRSRKFNGDTGLPRHADARVWLAAYRKRLRDQAVGIAAPADATPAPTLREGLAQWKAEAFRAGARHREIVRSSLELHLADALDQPMDTLTKPRVDQAIARYLAGAHRGRPHTEGGANVVLRALKCVVRHAVRAGRLPRMPFEGVALAEPHPLPRRALTLAELDCLLKELDEMQAPLQVRDLTLLMAGLGLRVTEACTARVEAFDPHRKEFTPWDPLLGTKGHTAVACPVPSWVLPHLLRLAGDRTEGYLVQGARGERPSRTLPARWLARARVKLRWPWLTPHDLRACYATWLSEEGVSPKVIQHLLRHRQLSTTERYLRHDLDTAREALERIGQKAGLTPPPVPAPPNLSPSSPRRFRVIRVK